MKIASGSLVVSNGQLISGTGAAPIPEAALVVKDGRIVYAGPAATAPQMPSDSVFIDACGGTIMPGLV
jgi:imidazolonepropionase-like amidohydrolase